MASLCAASHQENQHWTAGNREEMHFLWKINIIILHLMHITMTCGYLHGSQLLLTTEPTVLKAQ